MTDGLTSIQRILDKPDDEDCDGLLRDAMRLSLLQHPDMEEDDQDTLYDCIRALIGRYIESPEGEGEDAQILMTRRSGRGGRRFKSCHSDQRNPGNIGTSYSCLKRSRFSGTVIGAETP